LPATDKAPKTAEEQGNAHLLNASEDVLYPLLFTSLVLQYSLADVAIFGVVQSVPPSCTTESVTGVARLGSLYEIAARVDTVTYDKTRENCARQGQGGREEIKQGVSPVTAHVGFALYHTWNTQSC